jgi:hypothetical protein
LDLSKDPGHDDFSPSIIRSVAVEIGVPLPRLINVCLEVGNYPDFLKVSRITPVFKAGDPTQFENYRPISVLSVFYKVFERVIRKDLSVFLKSRVISLAVGIYFVVVIPPTWQSWWNNGGKKLKSMAKGRTMYGDFYRL